MRTLKAILYLILFLCVLWGLTISIGPKIMDLVLSRSFGEHQLRLTGLAISPKLQISASRAEFNFSDNGRTLYGTLRAPKIKISPTANGWSVQVSSGLMQVNDAIVISSLRADFRTQSITKIDAGMLSVSTPKLVMAEDFEFSEVNLSSSVNFSSLELLSPTFSAKKLSAVGPLQGDISSFDQIKGHIAKLSILQDWQSQTLGFGLAVETSEVRSDLFGDVKIKSLLLKAKNNGSILDTVLEAKSLSFDEQGVYFEGVKASSIINPITLTFREQTRVNIDQGSFKRVKPNKISGNITDLEAVLGLHLPERSLKLTSNVSNFELWNDKVSLIAIQELEVGMKTLISPILQVQDVSAQFEAAINSEGGSLVEGGMAIKLFSLEGEDCLTVSCSILAVLLDFNYEFEGEQITGTGSCETGRCDDKTFVFKVQTSNTAKIVTGLTKQRFVHPFALLMFAGSLMQGQEVGLGHKIKF